MNYQYNGLSAESASKSWRIQHFIIDGLYSRSRERELELTHNQNQHIAVAAGTAIGGILKSLGVGEPKDRTGDWLRSASAKLQRAARLFPDP
jgi:hypothetical protein